MARKNSIIKEQNGQEETIEGKSVVWIEGTYKLWKSRYFRQKLTTGNFLEIIKYKIIGLQHSSCPQACVYCVTLQRNDGGAGEST